MVLQLEVATQVQLDEVDGERMMPDVEESLVVEVDGLPQANPASKWEGRGEMRSRWNRRTSMMENETSDNMSQL